MKQAEYIAIDINKDNLKKSSFVLNRSFQGRFNYAEVKGKNSRTIWPDMTAFSKSVLICMPFLEKLLFQSLCVRRVTWKMY